MTSHSNIDKTDWIPAEGTLARKILFIGEAPASTEIQLHRLFVGRAGREQDRLNLLVGIQRGDARWTNVMKRRPPNDDITLFIDLSGKKKPDYEHFLNWISGEVQEPPPGINHLCKDHIIDLFAEVDSFRGNVIVPLGNVPLWVLTGLTAITKRRGSILTARGKKIVPCVHPSSILRSYSLIERRFAVLDLERVRNEAKSPDLNMIVHTYRTYPTFLEAKDYLEHCHSLENVGFDIECMRVGNGALEVSCLALAHSTTDAMCIPFVTQRHSYFTEAEEVEIWTILARVLADWNVAKTGQNIIFDASFMYRTLGILTNNMHDTMIGHTIRYPDLRTKVNKKQGEASQVKGTVGLDLLTRFYTREPYYKDEGKEWSNFWHFEESFFIYNAKDACIVLEILPQELQRLEEQDRYDPNV